MGDVCMIVACPFSGGWLAYAGCEDGMSEWVNIKEGMRFPPSQNIAGHFVDATHFPHRYDNWFIYTIHIAFIDLNTMTGRIAVASGWANIYLWRNSSISSGEMHQLGTL